MKITLEISYFHVFHKAKV